MRRRLRLAADYGRTKFALVNMSKLDKINNRSKLRFANSAKLIFIKKEDTGIPVEDAVHRLYLIFSSMLRAIFILFFCTNSHLFAVKTMPSAIFIFSWSHLFAVQIC
jgi:hypothetical protein